MEQFVVVMVVDCGVHKMLLFCSGLLTVVGHVLVMVAVMLVLIEGINRQFLGQESESQHVSVHICAL